MLDVKIPAPGESISEVEIATWLVEDGDLVRKDQDLAEIESDKATLILNAPGSGRLLIRVPAGETVSVGEIACQIDTSVEMPEDSLAGSSIPGGQGKPLKEMRGVDKTVSVSSEPLSFKETTIQNQENVVMKRVEKSDSPYSGVKMTPLAREKMKVAGLSVEDVINGIRKLNAADIDALVSLPHDASDLNADTPVRTEKRKKMSQLRKKLSQRLVKVKNETAMLTTFNEVDMTAVLEVRKEYQDAFSQKHGVKLGLMSFFIKASALALVMRPLVNSMIDNDELVMPDYVDISFAVQTPRGLLVPVIRNAESLSMSEVESSLGKLAARARSGRISLEEMSGGTFTITNGGVFGSLLSTPLINPPQSAILGMHNIVERPVAVNGRVEVRPMMYLALSYDHRLIDGKDSVGFLKDVKKMIETPRLLWTRGADPITRLLGL